MIRHGKAESNESPLDRLVGEHADLLDEGRQQISRTAEFLSQLVSVQTVYCSPLPRTYQSALIIARSLRAEVVKDSRLQEIIRGEWEGRPVEEVIELEADVDIDERHTFRPPGGENWEDVGERMINFAEEMHKSNQKEVVAVSHDHPIRMGVGALLQAPVIKWEDIPVDYASVTMLEYQAGVWRINTDISNKTIP